MNQLMPILPFNPHLDAKVAEAAERVRRPVSEAILQAASEVFAREGYAAAKVQSIANRAGLPKANVLYYFKSKDNLYSQVLERIAAPYLDACSAFHEQEQPLAALTRHIRGLSRLLQEQPFGARILMAELAAGATRLSTEHRERWRSQAQQSVAQLREWIDRGLLAPVEPQHVLIQIWAMAQACTHFGWQMPRVIGKSALDASDRLGLDDAIQLLLRGLAPQQIMPLAKRYGTAD